MQKIAGNQSCHESARFDAMCSGSVKTARLTLRAHVVSSWDRTAPFLFLFDTRFSELDANGEPPGSNDVSCNYSHIYARRRAIGSAHAPLSFEVFYACLQINSATLEILEYSLQTPAKGRRGPSLLGDWMMFVGKIRCNQALSPPRGRSRPLLHRYWTRGKLTNKTDGYRSYCIYVHRYHSNRNRLT